MFHRTFNKAGQTRRFSIESINGSGWEARIEHNDEVLRRVIIHDWPRVKSTLRTFAFLGKSLAVNGWRES